MKKSDNRKQNRVSPQKQTYAVMRPMFETMGKVMDISSGGLSIEYIAADGLDDQFAEVDLMLMDQDLILQKLPCRVVYDNKVEDAGGHAGLMLRRCGLELGSLNTNQQAMLKMFLGGRSLATA